MENNFDQKIDNLRVLVNAKLLLSKLPDGKDYYITGHGVIRKKEDSQSDGGSRENGGDENGDQAEEGEPATKVSDNTKTRESSGINNDGNARSDNEPRQTRKGSKRHERNEAVRSQRPRPAEKDRASKQQKNTWRIHQRRTAETIIQTT